MTTGKLVVAMLVASTAVVSGCLEEEMVLLVRPDGSGTLTCKMLLTQEFTTLRTQASEGRDAEPVNMVEKMIPKKVRAQLVADLGGAVTVKSLRDIKQEDGRQGAEVVFAFKDVNAVEPVSYTHLTLPTN